MGIARVIIPESVEAPAPAAGAPKLVVVDAEALTEAPVVSPNLARIGEALATFSVDAAKLGSDRWFQIGSAMWWATGGSEEGFQLFDEWSKPWIYYSAADTRRRWDNCNQSPPAEMDTDTIYKLAEKVREQTQALDEAAQLDDVAYSSQRADLKQRTGLSLAALDAERLRRRRRAASAPPPAPAPPPIEQLAEEAKDLIATDDVLAAFVESISPRLAGANSGRAELLYLCATSRLFDKPMNVALKGESAAGKSYERDAVLSYMPPEDVVAMTTMTEKALIYLPDDLSHKILSMAEAVSNDETTMQDYLIREIISEGRVTHWVTVPRGPGELPTSQAVVKEGPIMFVTTTTRARLHPELETRILSLEADDTAPHTRRVLETIASKGDSDGAPDLDHWHAYQRWLAAGERRVVVPYARTLASHPDLYVKSVRMRRDFGQVLNAIQAHALLHREHRGRDDKGRIVATIRDYTSVYDLLAARLAQGAGIMLNAADQRVLNAILKLQEDLPEREGIKVQDLVRELNLSQPTVNRRLSKLLLNGFAENLNPGKGKTGRFRANENPGDVAILPAPEDLLEADKKKAP